MKKFTFLNWIIFTLLLFIGSTSLFAQTPGGVGSGGRGLDDLSLWLKANTGVTVTGTDVSTWADQSGNGYDFTQATISGTKPVPALEANAINFNPAIDFDIGEMLSNTSELLPPTQFPKGNLTIFIASFRENPSTGLSNVLFTLNDFNGLVSPRMLAHYDRNTTGTQAIYDVDANANRISGAPAAGVTSTSTSTVGTFVVSSTTGRQILINGEEVASNTTPITIKDMDVTSFGGFNGANAPSLDTDIGEFIIYNGDVTGDDRTKVSTYLALKYGSTLLNTDYLASDGTNIYPIDATYNTSIFGLANDSGSGLNQQIATAISDGSIITLSTDTNFASVNGTHTSLTDGQFLVSGSNGLAPASYSNTGAPANYARVPSEWIVKNTGAVGEVNIQVDATNFPDFTIGNLYLVKGTDLTTATPIQMTNTSGDLWSTAVTFTDGDVYTFAVLNSVTVEYNVSKAASTDETIADNFPSILVSGILNIPTTVTNTITGGTATNADDYLVTGTFPSVDIPAGDYSTTTLIQALEVPTLIDDTDYEANETIGLQLTNAGNGVTLNGQNTSNYTITDDDPQIDVLIEFEAAAYGDDENVGGNLPNVLLNGNLVADAIVDIVIGAGGTDPATLGTDYTFGGSTDALPQTFSVLIPAANYTNQTLALSSLDIANEQNFDATYPTVQNTSADDGQTPITPSETITISEAGTYEITLSAEAFQATAGSNNAAANGGITFKDAGGTVIYSTPGADRIKSTTPEQTYSFTVASAGTYTLETFAGGSSRMTNVQTTLTFVPGPLGFAITGDTDIEEDETVDLTLQNPQNGLVLQDVDAGGLISNSIYTITNDDVALCEAVTDATATLQTGQEASAIDVSWTLAATTPENYTVVAFETDPADPLTAAPDATSGTLAATEANASLSGLQSQTQYFVYIISNCAAGAQEVASAGSVTTEEYKYSYSLDNTAIYEDDVTGPNDFTITATIANGINNSGVDLIIPITNTPAVTTLSSFDLQTGNIGINDGASTGLFNPSTINDLIVENDESAAITGPTSEIDATEIAIGTVTIISDDVATIEISNPVDGAEGGVDGSFDVQLSTNAEFDVAVTFVTSGTASEGSDYNTVIITIPASALPTSIPENDGTSSAITIPVTITDDMEVETGGELATFEITGTNSTLVTAGSTATESITIADNDTAEVTITSTTATAAEDDAAREFIVTMSAVSSTPVIVNYTIGGDVAVEDYVSAATSGSVTIDAGDTSAIINISVVDDFLVEDSENLVITLVSTDNASVSIGAADAAMSIVTDNDIPGFTVTPLALIVNEGGTEVFTVVLDVQPDSDVVFDITSLDTAEATVDLSTLMFTPTNWNIPQTISVTGVDDATVVDQSTSITVAVNAASSDDNFDVVANETVTVDLPNDDIVVGPTINTAGPYVVDENAGTITLSIVLGSQPITDVVIDYVVSDPLQGTTSVMQMTFTNGNWDTEQLITFTAIDDTDITGDFDVTVTATVNDALSDDSYDGGVVTATVTIMDDDADPTNSNTTIAATGPVVADGTEVSTVTVQLADADGNPITTGGDTVELSVSGNAVLVSGVTDNGNGTYTATVSNLLVESVTVTATLNGTAITNNAAISFILDTDATCTINCDTDNDGDCDLNCDTDGDGSCDVNCDTTGDGSCNLNCDTTGDGNPDTNVDTTGDGNCNLNCDTNGDSTCNLNCDTTGDGNPDTNVDTTGDGNCNLNCDTTGDGTCNLNCDTTGDGNPDTNVDTTGDGSCNLNCDTTGDGTCNLNCDTTGDGNPDTNVDTTGDGNCNLNCDTTGDGNPDTNIDTTGDGNCNLNCDTTGDGSCNLNCDTTGDGNPDTNIDMDGDGTCDLNCDTTGDGNCNLNCDTTGDGNPDTNIDTDGDGTCDLNCDTDGDGEPDTNIDTDGDGVCDLNCDTNGDGACSLNCDTDGDGQPDTNVDTDGDGNCDYQCAPDNDSDGDGVPDSEECPDFPNCRDTDGDGIPDYQDTDDDGDGVPNNEEDANGDGDLTNDDCDNDGIPNYLDGDACSISAKNIATAFTPNGDGMNDAWVIQGIENFPNSLVKVYNRYGHEVFGAQGYQNNWGGNYEDNSNLLPPGSYYYVINLGDGSTPIDGWIFINY